MHELLSELVNDWKCVTAVNEAGQIARVVVHELLSELVNDWRCVAAVSEAGQIARQAELAGCASGVG